MEWEEDTRGRTSVAVQAFAARFGSGEAGDSKWVWAFGSWSQWVLLVDGCGGVGEGGVSTNGCKASHYLHVWLLPLEGTVICVA